MGATVKEDHTVPYLRSQSQDLSLKSDHAPCVRTEAQSGLISPDFGNFEIGFKLVKLGEKSHHTWKPWLHSEFGKFILYVLSS